MFEAVSETKPTKTAEPATNPALELYYGPTLLALTGAFLFNYSGEMSPGIVAYLGNNVDIDLSQEISEAR